MTVAQVRAAPPRGTAALLRAVPLLEDMTDAQLAALARRVRRLRVRPGTVVMREGEPADGLYLLVRGVLEVTRAEAGEELLVGRLGAGDFVGEMALLDGAPRTATVRACSRSELLVIAPADFHELVGATPATLAVLRAVGRRLAATEAALLQRHRLAALGTLAAGLAHELNNPAAALAASALQLERRLVELESRALAAGALAEVARAAVAAVPAAPLRQKTDTEALADWLRAQEVAQPDRGAHALAAHGWDAAQLQRLASAVPPPHRPALLLLLAARSDAAVLARDVLHAARAISGVVESVRAHVAAESAPRRPLSLRDSITGALDVLRPRLHEGIDLVVEAPHDVLLHAHPGELSQMWTNLIANALDALNGRGRVRVRLRRRGAHVVVEVCDDGSGIPPAVRGRIFEPFFTTKPPSHGMGLGLHVVRRLVVEQYHGRIDVRSRPGRTVFRVVLPLEKTHTLAQS